MAKENKKIKDKIAEISDFVSQKDGEDIPGEVKAEEQKTEEKASFDKAGEGIDELTPEQLKEKIVKLVSDIVSQGLPEEEKTKFIDNFKLWNGIAFDVLDISNHLKTVVGQTSFKVTPGQALLIYLGITGILVVSLRPDLQNRIFNKDKDGKKASVIKTVEDTGNENNTYEYERV